MTKGRFGLKGIKKRAQQGSDNAPEEKEAHAHKRESDESLVYLSVRVPKSHRDWWMGQIKLNGGSLTDVVRELMEERFGLPDSE